MEDLLHLPLPQTELEFPLMKAIQQRRTKRKWLSEHLSEQEIANILWVACGLTRKESKYSKSRRTVPSACNMQEIKVFVALKTGLYLYDEREHLLKKTQNSDVREHIGSQKMMQTAPLGLIYVADFSRMKSILFRDNAKKWFTAAADAGFISQNVYLYCAAASLNTAVLSLVDRDKLHDLMGLPENEKVVFTQVIGKNA